MGSSGTAAYRLALMAACLLPRQLGPCPAGGDSGSNGRPAGKGRRRTHAVATAWLFTIVRRRRRQPLEASSSASLTPRQPDTSLDLGGALERNYDQYRSKHEFPPWGVATCGRRGYGMSVGIIEDAWNDATPLLIRARLARLQPTPSGHRPAGRASAGPLCEPTRGCPQLAAILLR